MLSATIKQRVSRFEKEYPAATDVLTNCIYIGDLITGTGTVEDAVNISKHSHEIMEEASMNLRKWMPNHKLLMKTWYGLEFSSLPQYFEDNKIHKVLVYNLIWIYV